MFFIFRKLINNDHAYNELDMSTVLNVKIAMPAKSPDPKTDKMIFDTKGIEPPTYQPLPKLQYENFSTEKTSKQHEETLKQNTTLPATI